MPHEPMHAETDVLVIGSGAAGMYAAIEAARAGCQRAARRPQPDRPRRRHRDGADDGRGRARVARRPITGAIITKIRSPPGAAFATSRWRSCYAKTGPDCIREMDEWGVGWARKDGRITQAMAPGHDRPRCVYVDFLNTGPAVSKTLRTVVNKNGGHPQGRRPLHRRSIAQGRRHRWRGRAPSWLGRAGHSIGQGDHHRDRRAHAALPPQQRIGQHGRRRLCAGAARRRVAGGHGIRPVLSHRPSGAAA